MSKLNNVLLIKPGKYVVDGEGEVHISKGHTCPRCNGRGYFIHETGRDKCTETPCPACKGVGRLKAHIVTKWMPDESKN